MLWRRTELGYVAGLGLLFQASMLFIGLIAFLLLRPLLSTVPFDLGDGPSGEDAAPNDEGATDQLHDWLESVTPDDFAP